MSETKTPVIVYALVAGFGCGLVAQANQDAPPFAAYIGEITEDRVNVRSGPSTNYYVVTKLGAGDRVRVVDKGEGDWLAVAPPKGVYSVISSEVVDVGDDHTGVVNTDRVRVYADAMNEKQKRYAYNYHPRLKRGTVVRIIESAVGGDDGLLRIVPPDGATVWIHGDYVVAVPPEILGRETKRPKPADQVAPDATTKPVNVSTTTETPVETPVESPLEAPGQDSVTGAAGDSKIDASVTTSIPPTPDQAASARDDGDDADLKTRLAAAEAQLTEEMAKPAARRDLRPLIEQYRRMAESQEDRYVETFAGARLEQLEYLSEVAVALKQMRELGEEVRAERKQRLAERAALRPEPKPIDPVFDAQGELRTSAIYTSSVGPRRYRLIDPDASTTRTIAYIEIPDDAEYDVAGFVGRRIGVRARSRIFQTGGVEPIVIYVADALVLLDESTNSTEAVTDARPRQ